MLKSTDSSLLSDAFFDGNSKLLDGGPLDGNRIGFVGFARSGTNYLRKVIEQLTGVATGSTVTLEGTGTMIQAQALKAEAIIDERVWVVKTHHPLNYLGSPPYTSDKLLYIVRNPLDVIVSCLTFMNTINHANKPGFEFEVAYPEWWKEMLPHWVEGVKKAY